MDEQEYRIFETLSRRLGTSLSINEITKKMDEKYGGAYYANIHEKIKELVKDGIITQTKTGRSLLISHNFANYMIVDVLAEMELKRKQIFLKGKQEMQMLMLEIDTYLHNIPLIKSVSLMYPEKNNKLNKAELLIQLKESDDRTSIEKTKIEIYKLIGTVQQIHNIRIDYLVIENETFFEFLRSNELNPIKEMLSNKIVILHPQDFWMAIREATEKGIKLSSEENETSPAKISEDDLVFNLTRFGYTEFGPTLKDGKLICMEYIISAIMFHNDARRMDAVAVILAKNSKISYDLLLFLARKYSFEGQMLGILRTLRNLVAHGMKTIDEPIRLLDAMKTEEIKSDMKRIKEMLRIYNVTG